MADKTDKMADKKARKNVRNKGSVYQGEIRPVVMQVLVLRHLGWSIPATAQACCVGERSVFEWCKKYKDTFAELPAIQAAKDAIQCLIPKAVKVYEKSLDSVNRSGVPSVIAADIATKVLISNRVTTDRKVIEDEREQPTDRLIEELDKIQSSFAHSPAGPGETGSDSGDTPGA